MNTERNPEQEYLESYDESQYKKMSVTVDLLIVTIEEDRLKVLMTKRSEYPFKDYWSLPGVFVGIDETLEDAAIRGLKEETGVENVYLEQLYTFGQPDRDPRLRVISVAYMALMPAEQLHFKAGSRVSDVKLVPMEEIISGNVETAFDHRDIISYARWRLKNKVEYTDIVFHFFPEMFTLPKLQKAYEILADKKVYKTNFRKKFGPLVEETGQKDRSGGRRPSQYFVKK
ncbi:MAG: NUDIX hydrolase [Eubacterium sp.]|nr:NUDIX hydrolase [Eubacterium sp.]